MSDENSVLGDIACGHAEAEAKAGAREIDGNNGGPFVDKYLNANHPERITHNGEPWCAAFFLWCWLQALRPLGRDLPFRFTRSASVLWSRLQELGQAWPAAGQAQLALMLKPGDALFWDWDGNNSPNHVNMLHHVDADGVIFTIGGNEGKESSGAPVRIKKRGKVGELPALLGFGRVVLS